MWRKIILSIFLVFALALFLYISVKNILRPSNTYQEIDLIKKEIIRI